METALRGYLPNDDQYWRIEWVDGVYPNSAVPTEKMLGVSVAPLLNVVVPNQPTPAEALKTDSAQRRFLKIGVGLMPSLIVGSVWRYRQMLPVVPYQQRQFNVDLGSTSLQLLDAGHLLEPRRWLIPPFKYEIPATMRQSRCAAVALQSGPYSIIIPCFEILRAWYVRSTAMANRLFSGPLTMACESIYDPSKSGIVNGQWKVQLRTGMSQSDALPAALLACDKPAFERVARLFDSIIARNVAKQPAGIELLPPSCTGRLVGRGVDVSIGGDSRFLIFDLLEVPYPSPPGSIIWDLDNSNATDPDAEERPREAWVGRPTERPSTTTDIVVHVEEPDNNGGTTRESYQAPRISTPTPLTRLEPESPTAKGAAPHPPKDMETNQHSTGGGTYGATSSRRLSIVSGSEEEKSRAPRKVIGFKTVFRIQNLLRQYPRTSCELVPAGAMTADYPEGVRSLFPSMIDKKKYAWSLVDGEKRQVVVLEIKQGLLHGYAFEIERRPPPPGSKSESFRIGFVSAADLVRVDDRALGAVLPALVKKNGVWHSEGGRVETFDLRTFKHDRTADVLAFEILNELRRRARFALMPDSQMIKDQEPIESKSGEDVQDAPSA